MGKGIHSDENGRVEFELDHCSVYDDLCGTFSFCVLNNVDQLGDYRKNMDFYSVEFIEAGPKTTGGHTFEKLAHSFKVKGA